MNGRPGNDEARRRHDESKHVRMMKDMMGKMIPSKRRFQMSNQNGSRRKGLESGANASRAEVEAENDSGRL